MDVNLIVFLVLALVAIGSALGMLFNKNAVYAALFLIVNFASVAVLYLVLGAPMISMIQVTVYAGAIFGAGYRFFHIVCRRTGVA